MVCTSGTGEEFMPHVYATHVLSFCFHLNFYIVTPFFKDFSTQLLRHHHSGLLPDFSFYFMTLLLLFFSNFSFTQF